MQTPEQIAAEMERKRAADAAATANAVAPQNLPAAAAANAAAAPNPPDDAGARAAAAGPRVIPGAPPAARAVAPNDAQKKEEKPLPKNWVRTESGEALTEFLRKDAEEYSKEEPKDVNEAKELGEARITRAQFFLTPGLAVSDPPENWLMFVFPARFVVKKNSTVFPTNENTGKDEQTFHQHPVIKAILSDPDLILKHAAEDLSHESEFLVYYKISDKNRTFLSIDRIFNKLVEVKLLTIDESQYFKEETLRVFHLRRLDFTPAATFFREMVKQKRQDEADRLVAKIKEIRTTFERKKYDHVIFLFQNSGIDKENLITQQSYEDLIHLAQISVAQRAFEEKRYDEAIHLAQKLHLGAKEKSKAIFLEGSRQCSFENDEINSMILGYSYLGGNRIFFTEKEEIAYHLGLWLKTISPKHAIKAWEIHSLGSGFFHHAQKMIIDLLCDLSKAEEGVRRRIILKKTIKHLHRSIQHPDLFILSSPLHPALPSYKELMSNFIKVISEYADESNSLKETFQKEIQQLEDLKTKKDEPEKKFSPLYLFSSDFNESEKMYLFTSLLISANTKLAAKLQKQKPVKTVSASESVSACMNASANENASAQAPTSLVKASTNAAADKDAAADKKGDAEISFLPVGWEVLGNPVALKQNSSSLEFVTFTRSRTENDKKIDADKKDEKDKKSKEEVDAHLKETLIEIRFARELTIDDTITKKPVYKGKGIPMIMLLSYPNPDLKDDRFPAIESFRVRCAENGLLRDFVHQQVGTLIENYRGDLYRSRITEHLRKKPENSKKATESSRKEYEEPKTVSNLVLVGYMRPWMLDDLFSLLVETGVLSYTEADYFKSLCDPAPEPKEEIELLNRAYNAIENKKFVEVIRLAKESQQKFPDMNGAFRIGEMLLKCEAFEQALQSFELALPSEGFRMNAKQLGIYNSSIQTYPIPVEAIWEKISETMMLLTMGIQQPIPHDKYNALIIHIMNAIIKTLIPNPSNFSQLLLLLELQLGYNPFKNPCRLFDKFRGKPYSSELMLETLLIVSDQLYQMNLNEKKVANDYPNLQNASAAAAPTAAVTSLVYSAGAQAASVSTAANTIANSSAAASAAAAAAAPASSIGTGSLDDWEDSDDEVDRISAPCFWKS